MIYPELPRLVVVGLTATSRRAAEPPNQGTDYTTWGKL